MQVWTDEEEKALRNLSKTPKELAEELHRTPASIRAKRWRMKLPTTDAIYAPSKLSSREKEYRIRVLAKQMRIRIK